MYLVMKESLYFPAIRFAGRLFLIGKHARQPAPQIVRKLLAVMSGPTVRVSRPPERSGGGSAGRAG